MMKMLEFIGGLYLIFHGHLLGIFFIFDSMLRED